MAGQESGVRFALFQPGQPREQDFYLIYPVQLRVEGAYHAVGRFMAEVANLNRIVNIVDLTMISTDPDERSPERTVVASFTAETYAFKDVSQRPGQGTAKWEGK
jgi:Tfp pilus assembly protein PilO